MAASVAPQPQDGSWASAMDLEDDNLGALLLGFRGRVPRRTFWLVGLIGLGLLQTYASLLLDIAGAQPRVSDGIAAALVAWPAAAITVKRWHDRNRSGWWLLVNLLPVVGMLWTLLQCGLLRGTAGDNRYGPDPSGAAAPEDAGDTLPLSMIRDPG